MDIPDAHCHIDQLIGRRGGSRVLDTLGPTIAVANDWSGYIVTSHLVGRRKQMHVSLGLHPRMALLRGRDLPLILDRISVVRFVGEIGLDYASKVGASAKRNQGVVFEAILQACEDTEKILNVHSTAAGREVVDALRSFNVRRIIMHWYTGPSGPLTDAIQEGWYVSIPPGVDKSKTVQRVARVVPLDQLLIESDAPAGIRSAESVKHALGRVASRLAAIHRMSTADVVDAVSENYARLTQPHAAIRSTQATLDRE